MVALYGKPRTGGFGEVYPAPPVRGGFGESVPASALQTPAPPRPGLFGRAGNWLRSRDWERIAASLRDDPVHVQMLQEQRQGEQMMAMRIAEQQRAQGLANTADKQRQTALGALPEDLRGIALINPEAATTEYLRRSRGPEFGAPETIHGRLAQRNLQTGEVDWAPSLPSRAAAAPSLSEQTIDYAAQQYMLTGRLPPGMTRNTRIISQVMERVAQVAGEQGQSAGDVAFQGANYEANAGGLRSLQRQRTLVQSFERTALSNLELAQRYSEQVPRTDYPAVNHAIMTGQLQTGNSATAQYINAVIGARTEYAKVLSGATGAAGLTDSARAEAEEMFSAAASPETFRALVDTAREEMHNRIVAFDAQEEYLRQRMTGQGGGESHGSAPLSNVHDRPRGNIRGGRSTGAARPSGITQSEWDHMTPEERALWR